MDGQDANGMAVIFYRSLISSEVLGTFFSWREKKAVQDWKLATIEQEQSKEVTQESSWGMGC